MSYSVKTDSGGTDSGGESRGGLRRPKGWDPRVLGYWQLCFNGAPVEVGARQQRLLAALAVLHTQPRPVLAARL
ncbi:hypothetical protein [Cryobacterium serini]|uniref:Uncharacterized protein n=1 Tax=Cryobacterium serini TaxID=1259201 RepID=A0A4R9BHM2_9MICO|nr:hypothetical protein [Cryobacterium serini]TFD84935.1 hypothetical protein E3T51_16475 [Cryobacterium serini]